jgi:hypothetical protein
MDTNSTMNHNLTRRHFLEAVASSVAALTGACVALPAFARNIVANESPAALTPCLPSAWKKHGIILDATEPWEGGSIQNFTCPAEPLEGDRWRLWYSSSSKVYAIAYAEGVLGGPFKKFSACCSPGEPPDEPFAIGNLPEKWKPVQGIHLLLRNGRHRIYFWAHGPGIVRYLAAESEDGRRYRVLDPQRPVLHHPHDRAAWGVADPDGVLMHKERHKDRPADEPLALSRQISNDATNIYQLPDGTFEMYSVGLQQVPKGDPAYVAFDNAPGWIRVIDRYASEDGLHFETRQRVITRDAEDPADQQFYYLAVTHTPKGRVGMLGHYRVQAQTMDLEWCFSRDGVKWDRPLRRAWLPRSHKSRVDSYGIYASNHLVQQGGKWHLFYTGVNSAHNGKESYGPKRSAIFHATTDSIWG